MLSNELEKENTLLFIMGFSLSDEHIREIVLRAANSNPTLLIKVFAYDADAGKVISENLKRGNSSIRYNNVEIIRPKDGEFFDFKTLNEQIFNVILNTID